MLEQFIDALLIDWEKKKGPCQWCEQECTDPRWCMENIEPLPETTLEETIADQ